MPRQTLTPKQQFRREFARGARVGRVRGPAMAVAALVSLGTLGGAVAFRTASANVDVAWTVEVQDQPAGALMVEPILAIDPTDAQHLVAASIAFTAEGMGTMVFSSRDGGRTWSAGHAAGTTDPLFPNIDPVVAFHPDGTPYLSTLHDGFAVWKRAGSDTVWVRVGTVPGGNYDRQWLAFDRSGGDHHGRLYSAGKIGIQVTDSPAQDVAAFSWSDDGGATFRAPVLVLPAPTLGSLNIVSGLLVLEDGSLLAPYHFIHWPEGGIPEGERWTPTSLDSEVALLRSRDGRQWEPVRIGGMRKWGHGEQEGMLKGMGSGGLAAGHGVVHAVWPHIVDGFLQVMAARSTDAGATWSAARRVNRGGRASNHSNPGVAVDSLGNVGVIWNDRRDDPGDRCFRPYFSVSMDRGETFDPEVALTDEPVCPPDGRWLNGGETQGLVGLPEGGFHAVWVGRGDGPGTSRLHSTRIRVR